jgi:biopolymer transport protein ExbD
MARRHHYRKPKAQDHELDVTTFMNLMVVLVPFLLITAVFSRLSIVELNLPSSTGGASNEPVPFTVEVIVRESGFEITNGRSVIAALPKKEGEYDLDGLAQHMLELKREYPDQDAASVLLEPMIPYDYLIQVMDVVRSIEQPTGENGALETYALFTQISVGDSP